MTMHEWKRALLADRICDLNRCAPWFAAIKVMVEAAICHIEADELEQCERCCEDAELVQVEHIRDWCGG